MFVWHNRFVWWIFFTIHFTSKWSHRFIRLGVILFLYFQFSYLFNIEFFIFVFLNFKMKFLETWSWKRTRNDLLHHPNERLYLVFLALDFVLFVKCISKSFEVTNCHIQELFLKLNMKFFLKANILLHDFLERNVDFFFYFSLL